MEETKILALFWERNEEAIKETDHAYGSKLFHLSCNILGRREDAQECVNDTYLQAWKSIPPKWPKFLYGFLAAICRNLSFNRLDWLLAAKRNAQVVELSQEMQLCIPDTRQDAQLEGRDLKQLLESFLDSLPQESRLIFLRRYLYGDTIDEIARRYCLGESKVKQQLHRTRARLRTYLEKEEFFV